VNRWNIPEVLERHVRERDKRCIYCQLDFSLPAVSRGARPSWEHIVNDERIITPANIALCCISCNASKGAKLLHVWLTSKYCARKGITPKSISAVAREALASPPTPLPQHVP
jgi:hypothetical protein